MGSGRTLDRHTLTGIAGWLYNEVAAAVHYCRYMRSISGIYSWSGLATRIANCLQIRFESIVNSSDKTDSVWIIIGQ
jgi:hypothetical protein